MADARAETKQSLAIKAKRNAKTGESGTMTAKSDSKMEGQWKPTWWGSLFHSENPVHGGHKGCL